MGDERDPPDEYAEADGTEILGAAAVSTALSKRRLREAMERRAERENQETDGTERLSVEMVAALDNKLSSRTARPPAPLDESGPPTVKRPPRSSSARPPAPLDESGPPTIKRPPRRSRPDLSPASGTSDALGRPAVASSGDSDDGRIGTLDILKRRDPSASSTNFELPADEDSEGYDSDDATDLIFANEVAHAVQKMAQERGQPEPTAKLPDPNVTPEERVDNAILQLRRMKEKNRSSSIQELRDFQLQKVAELAAEGSESSYDDSEDSTDLVYAAEVVSILQKVAHEEGAAAPEIRTRAESVDHAIDQLKVMKGTTGRLEALREEQFQRAVDLGAEASEAIHENEDATDMVYADEIIHIFEKVAEERAETEPEPQRKPEVLTAEERVDRALVQLHGLNETKEDREDIKQLREAQFREAVGLPASPTSARPTEEKAPWRPLRAFLWAVVLSVIAILEAALIAAFMWWPAMAAISVYALLWAVPASFVMLRIHKDSTLRAALPMLVFTICAAPLGAWSLPEVRIATLNLIAGNVNSEHLGRIFLDPSEPVVLAACAATAPHLNMAKFLTARAAKSPGLTLRCAGEIQNEEVQQRVLSLLAYHWAEQIRVAGRCDGLEPQIEAYMATRDLEQPEDIRGVVELTFQAASEDVRECMLASIPDDVKDDFTGRLGDPTTVTVNDDKIFTGLIQHAFAGNAIAKALGATTREAQLWTLRLGCQRLRIDPSSGETVSRLNGMATAIDGTMTVLADPETWVQWCAEFGGSLTFEDLLSKAKSDRLKKAVRAAVVIVHSGIKRQERTSLVGQMELGASREAAESDFGDLKVRAGTPAVFTNFANSLDYQLESGRAEGREIVKGAAGKDDEQFCAMARMRLSFTGQAAPEEIVGELGKDAPKPKDPDSDEPPEPALGEGSADYEKLVRKRCGDEFFETDGVEAKEDPDATKTKKKKKKKKNR